MWVSASIVPQFLISALHGGEWSASRHGIRSCLLRLLQMLHSNEDVCVTYLVASFRADFGLLNASSEWKSPAHLKVA
jgi:hypothetical protein